MSGQCHVISLALFFLSAPPPPPQFTKSVQSKWPRRAPWYPRQSAFAAKFAILPTSCSDAPYPASGSRVSSQNCTESRTRATKTNLHVRSRRTGLTNKSPRDSILQYGRPTVSAPCSPVTYTHNLDHFPGAPWPAACYTLGITHNPSATPITSRRRSHQLRLSPAISP